MPATAKMPATAVMTANCNNDSNSRNACRQLENFVEIHEKSKVAKTFSAYSQYSIG
jgi:hypothetical protein